MGEDKRPLSLGLWFSLGHSSVVFIMVALLAFGIRTLPNRSGTNSRLFNARPAGGVTSISGVFLVLIELVRSTQFGF